MNQKWWQPTPISSLILSSVFFSVPASWIFLLSKFTGVFKGQVPKFQSPKIPWLFNYHVSLVIISVRNITHYVSNTEVWFVVSNRLLQYTLVTLAIVIRFVSRLTPHQTNRLIRYESLMIRTNAIQTICLQFNSINLVHVSTARAIRTAHWPMWFSYRTPRTYFSNRLCRSLVELSDLTASNPFFDSSNAAISHPLRVLLNNTIEIQSPQQISSIPIRISSGHIFLRSVTL